MSAASQTAFSRSISTNLSGKKKRLQLFQRHGSPTSKKRPASEIHRKTSNGFLADKDKARFSTQISGSTHEKQSSFSEIEITEKESCRLHLYSSRAVADELCLMDGEILRKIDPSELHSGAWMKKEKDQLAPNVLSMVRASNELAMMVPSEVLEETSTHGRAKVVSSFIKIASKLHRLRNYNSLKAVLAGLQCTPIFRLKKTWKEVPSKRRKKFEKLSELMSEEYNWKHYRAELETCFTENLPCIPFLGVLLTTIVQHESATTSRGVKMSLSRNGRKRVSGVEMYTILEAITVRNRLEKLRKQSSAWRLSGIPAPEVKRPNFIRSKSHFSKDFLVYQDQHDVSGLTSTNRLLRLDEVDVTKTRKILVGDSSGSEEDEERLLVEEGRINEWIENNVDSAGMGMENGNSVSIIDHIGTTSSSDSESTSPILPPRCRVHAVRSIYSKRGVKKISADEVVHAKMSDSSEPDVASSMRKSLSESLALDEIMSRAETPAEIPELSETSDCSVDVSHSSDGDPVPNGSRRDETGNMSGAVTSLSAGHATCNSHGTSALTSRKDSSGALAHSNSTERLRKVTVLEAPAIEELYDAHLSEYAEVSRSLESLKEACDDLIGGPLSDDSPELIPKRQENGEVAGFVKKSLSLQSLPGLDDSLKSHSDSSLASSSSHSDTVKTGPASHLNITVHVDDAFEGLDHSSVTDDLQELDSELLSASRDRLRSSSIDDVFTGLEDNSSSDHVILRRHRRSSDVGGTSQDPSINQLASHEDIQETNSDEHRPRLNSRAEKFRKSSYGPVRRRSRRKASLVLRLAQLSTDSRQFDLDDHLLKYKFVSLRYSTEFESNPELRTLLTIRQRNSEAQNYILSYEREA